MFNKFVKNDVLNEKSHYDLLAEDIPVEEVVEEVVETVVPPTDSEIKPKKVKKMGKGLLRSKTVWINLLTAAVSIATYISGSELVASNPEVVAGIGMGIGFVNVILRLITKEPITGVIK